MCATRNFRVVINLSNYFHDHRNRARIFINEDIKRISDLASRIEKIFLIKNFYLTSQNEYLPPSEDVGILKNDEIIWVIQNENHNEEPPKIVTKKIVKKISNKRPISPTEEISSQESKKQKKKQKADADVTTENKISPTKKESPKKNKNFVDKIKMKKGDSNIILNKTKDTSTKQKEAQKKTGDENFSDQIATSSKEKNRCKKDKVMKVNTLLPVLQSHINTYNKKISSQAGTSSSTNISETNKIEKKKESKKKKSKYVCKGDLSSYKESVPIPTITDQYLEKKKINIIKVEFMNNPNGSNKNEMGLLTNTPNTSYSDDPYEDRGKVPKEIECLSSLSDDSDDLIKTTSTPEDEVAAIHSASSSEQNQQVQVISESESTSDNMETSPTANSHEQVGTGSNGDKLILPDGAASKNSDLAEKAKEYLKSELEKELYRVLNLFSVEDIPEKYKSEEPIGSIDESVHNIPNGMLNINKELEALMKHNANIDTTDTEDEKNGNKTDQAKASDVMDTSKPNTDESGDVCRADRNISVTSDTGIESLPSLSRRESHSFDEDGNRTDMNNTLNETIKPSDSPMLDLTKGDESTSSKISSYSRCARVSGVGQLLEDLRHNVSITSVDNSVSDCNESVTKKRVRKRKKKKKNKTNDADTSLVHPIRVANGFITPNAMPKQHLKFEIDDKGRIIGIDKRIGSSRNSLRASGSYVNLEDVTSNSSVCDMSFISEEDILKAPLMRTSRLPVAGDLIAFKILRLRENYTPGESAQIVGKVVDYNKETNDVVFQILIGLDQLGELEGVLPIGEESETNEPDESQRMMDWKDVMEPRLLLL